MKLVPFTAPNGTTMWICPTWVQAVAGAASNMSYAGSRTEITMSGGVRYVKEPLSLVVAMLRAEGIIKEEEIS